MKQYIEILLAIFCHNTIQYNTDDLGYRYIAHCNIYCYSPLLQVHARDNLNAKLTRLKHFYDSDWMHGLFLTP